AAVAGGTTIIIYSVTNSCTTATAAKTLTITPNANAGTVNGSSPLCIGATANYSSNGDAGGAWTSSNTSVATVSSSGLVIAVAAGTTNIIYSVSNSCTTATAAKTITVSPGVNAGTVSGSSPLCIGMTAIY